MQISIQKHNSDVERKIVKKGIKIASTSYLQNKRKYREQ